MGTAGSGATGTGGGTVGDLDAGFGDGSSDAGLGATATCQPTYTGCTGLCGSVTDFCTGNTFSCGTCGTGLACDGKTHECVTPKGTCAALGAECGRTRNTCGDVLDCGACDAGMECDPDTNQCVGCTLPANTATACQQMGIACGTAWLGCGPTTNTTNCGGCAPGSVCNEFFNTCEPTPLADGGTCTPMTVAKACTAVGNDCGYVSDGCGGTTYCGDCPVGQACGIYGVANVCNAPPATDACTLQNRVCGSANDVCGVPVACGSCPTGSDCTDAGQCQGVCQPTNCVALLGNEHVRLGRPRWVRRDELTATCAGSSTAGRSSAGRWTAAWASAARPPGRFPRDGRAGARPTAAEPTRALPPGKRARTPPPVLRAPGCRGTACRGGMWTTSPIAAAAWTFPARREKPARRPGPVASCPQRRPFPRGITVGRSPMPAGRDITATMARPAPRRMAAKSASARTPAGGTGTTESAVRGLTTAPAGPSPAPARAQATCAA